MQVLVNGRAEHFGQAKYQAAYEKSACTADLSKQPMHFHDGKDQLVHAHWKHLSGGMVLKYYGWDLVGGASGVLGYRFDNLPNITNVPVYGKIFPALSPKAKVWIYSGDESGHKQWPLDDFLGRDLESFFGRKSTVNTGEQTSFLDRLLPRAFAHGGEDDGHGDETQKQRLERINNLLGNVVIFVQQQEPSKQQVAARFTKLEPLSDSTCGG